MFRNLSVNRQAPATGFTLVELLITIFVLAIGITSAILFYTNAMRATEYARDITEATTQAQYIFEEMRTRPSLSNITATNWDTWSQSAGIKSLPSETINVVYANMLADPLDITTTVNWQKYSRQNSVSLRTELTK